MFRWQTWHDEIKVDGDTDYAGCAESRKSTSGGCVLWGEHCLKLRSKTQATIALSSAESELAAAVRTSSELLGLIAMAKDMGYLLEGDVWIDAVAAMGILNHQGCGKLRHLDTQLLWVQQNQLRGNLRYEKVDGKENPADLMTKGLDEATCNKHLGKLGCRFTRGRADKSVT